VLKGPLFNGFLPGDLCHHLFERIRVFLFFPLGLPGLLPLPKQKGPVRASSMLSSFFPEPPTRNYRPRTR